MEESLSLFYNTIHSQWFANSFIILFLNKMDILAEKIQFSDLKTYYPEFEGDLMHIKWSKSMYVLSCLSEPDPLFSFLSSVVWRHFQANVGT